MTTPNFSDASALDDFADAANAIGLAAMQQMQAEDWVQAQIENVTGSWGGIVEWITDGLGTIITDIMEFITTGDTANLTAASDYVQSKMGGLLDGVVTLFGGLIQALQGEYEGDDPALQVISGSLGKVVGWLLDLIDAIVSALRGVPVVGGTIADVFEEAANVKGLAQTASTDAELALTTANGKPSMEEIPIGSTLWLSINSDEDATFPRANLTNGAASSTSSGGGSGSHSHSLGQIPDYQPAGNGSKYLEIAYIRAARTRSYTVVGFITGDSQTFAGLQGAYVGVYLVNPASGALTLLNSSSAAVDIKDSITNTNTEQRFNMGITINASQGQTFAVATLQRTGAFQTCSSLMKTSITNIDPPSTQYPRKNYAYCRGLGGATSGFNSLPATINESDLNYSASTKVPFYCLR